MHLFEFSGLADATELFDFQWLAHPGASSIFAIRTRSAPLTVHRSVVLSTVSQTLLSPLFFSGPSPEGHQHRAAAPQACKLLASEIEEPDPGHKCCATLVTFDPSAEG
jgi:hypothetical protein